MVKISDYIMEFIHKRLNVDTIFTLTGGGSMYLNDAAAKHPHIKSIFNHHEQACAMGAVAYSKYTNGFGVAVVTTGCGGTNAITGLLDAWQDSCKCFFISGQVNVKQTQLFNKKGKPRKIGVQEANIIDIVKPLTKYATMVTNKNDISLVLEEALYHCQTGRPGPVWIDIPMDIQNDVIDETTLPHRMNSITFESIKDTEKQDLIFLISSSKNPLILAGNGIRLSNTVNNLKKFSREYNIPAVSTYFGIDYFDYDDSMFIGRVGIKGDRAGNFALQNCDLLIVLGCCLNVSVTGYVYPYFARNAKVVVVDIDKEEHQKQTVKIDMFIHSHLNNFFNSMECSIINSKINDEWITKCNHWKELWSYDNEKNYKPSGKSVDLYKFTSVLSKQLKSNSVVVSDAGSAFYVCGQNLKLKDNQRFVSSGQAEMGYAIPASIGVSTLNDNVVCITGDGSFQTNIQELQTIVNHSLPIKIFIWNNGGYLSIKATQKKFFNERYYGSVNGIKFSLPNIKKISESYGIKYFKIENNDDLENGISTVLNSDGYILCEVICDPDQEIIPTISTKKKDDDSIVSLPLEDMYPNLDKKTLEKEMVAPILDL